MYLDDKNFLKKLDLENHKELYLKIHALDFNTEKVLASIEGKSTGGSCNLSGTSSMRRTASCSLLVDPYGIKMQGRNEYQQYYNITEVENLISLNKKIKIYVGIYNSLAELNYYPEYDIIWIPLGLYVVKSANVSKNNSGVNISLTLNDKTALLNGDMGGTIPAATVLSESELFNATGTSREVQKILIKDLIKYIVVEFGGEKPENIIITDIPDTIVKVMKWTGNKTLYLVETPGSKHYTLEEPEGEYKEFSYGEDIGYMTEPFVYPGTLECNAGETASAMLDKIKNVLGNFEWFYDVYGRFHFQEIKNYLNNSQATELLELNEQDYLSKAAYSKSVYTFDREQKALINSYSNSPQYQNIKNDYVVWGTTKTASGVDKPIRYHVAFDNKPDINVNGYNCIVYTDYKRSQQIIPLIEGETYQIYTPGMEIDKALYYLYKKDNKYLVLHWDDEINLMREYEDYEVCNLRSDDWRTELFFRSAFASDKTFSKNYYAAELNAEWTKIYNLKGQTSTEVAILKEGEDINIPVYNGCYRVDVSQSNYEFWLDFLEGSQGGNQSISQFNVKNIGRRTKVLTDNNANCLFPNEVPNYILVEADGDVEDEIAAIQKLNPDREVIQVSSEIFKDLSLGGTRNSAYEKIVDLINQKKSS